MIYPAFPSGSICLSQFFKCVRYENMYSALGMGGGGGGGEGGRGLHKLIVYEYYDFNL
jgi:hypothetical protein